MPVPVATSSTRSSFLAQTAAARARRQRGSWPIDKTVATHSYESAIPAKSRRACRERAEAADSITSVVAPPVLGNLDGANGETRGIQRTALGVAAVWPVGSPYTHVYRLDWTSSRRAECVDPIQREKLRVLNLERHYARSRPNTRENYESSKISCLARSCRRCLGVVRSVGNCCSRAGRWRTGCQPDLRANQPRL